MEARYDGTVYTVGHSTRSEDEFLTLLEAAEVRVVADVRAHPGSRRHPQYGAEEMARWLPSAGLGYVHLRDLGGRRKPVPGSTNAGWRESAFQGYADYMHTRGFQAALEELEQLARVARTAVMCAESLWWRCHRRLVADALTVRGWRVEHLGVGDNRVVHELPAFAVIEGDALTYPPPQGSLL